MLPDTHQIRKTLITLKVTELIGSRLPQNAVIVSETQEPLITEADGITFLLLEKRKGKKTPLTIPELVSLLEEELIKARHAYCDRSSSVARQLAINLLSFCSLLKFPFEGLNNILSAIDDTHVETWTIRETIVANEDPYTFGDFNVGPLDLSRLKHLCEHAGSDYHTRLPKTLSRSLALHRCARSIRTVNFASIKDNAIPRSEGSTGYAPHLLTKLSDQVLNAYYGQLAEKERHSFSLDIERQQARLKMCGHPTISYDPLRWWKDQTRLITVFYRDLPKHGWVYPNKTFLAISNTSTKSAKNTIESIISELRLSDLGKNPLDDTLNRFCEYYQASTTLSRRLDEALLHQVFGLDLLLGGSPKEGLTNALANRVAMLTHLASKEPFEQVVKFMRETYNLRSSYVHRGALGKQENLSLKNRLTRLTGYCKLAFAAGAFARNQAWCCDKDARSKWIKRIDHLVASLEAEIEIQESDLENLGINRISLTPDRSCNISIAWPTDKNTTQSH